jgi:hypothetical protein
VVFVTCNELSPPDNNNNNCEQEAARETYLGTTETCFREPQAEPLGDDDNLSFCMHVAP